jgi:hypothetical protein
VGDIPLELRLNLSTLKTTDFPVEHEGYRVLTAIMIENSSSFNRELSENIC